MGFKDLFQTPRTNVVSSILQFPAIDTDGMIKKMRLNERAKEQGRANLPAAESQAFDAIEQSIANEIENEGKTQFDLYLSHQKTYAERANDTGIQALLLQIGATASSASTDFERNTRIGTTELYADRRAVIETEKELNRFRRRHGLDRPARDIGARTYKIGLLIFLLAIEAGLNGLFLQKGNVFGFVGGAFEALLIASLNIFFGVATGRFLLPSLTHRNWGVRIIAAFGAIVYVAAALAFNLAVAHYREAVAIDPFDASVKAYHTLLSTPLAIEDLQSWSLSLIGFIFSLIAAYDGLRMDDPYPGYGHRMRQNLSALDDYASLKDDLLGQLEEIKQSAEKTINDIVQKIETRQNEFGYTVRKSQALKAEMSQHFSHLETAGNTLLRHYRDENRKHRSAPAPARFDAPWTYQHPVLEDPMAGSPQGDPEEALKKAFQDVPRERDRLHAAYRDALAEYARVDELVE